MSERTKAIKRKNARQPITKARTYWESVVNDRGSNTRYLISRLDSSSSEAFPFEQALSFYLLFIAALWPNDHNRISMAARIFAASLNYHIAAVSRDRVFSVNGEHFVFHNHFSQRRLALFNETFFKEIGGPYSLLFTDSIAQFHRDVLKKVSELRMIHDVISFLTKASVVSSRLSSSRIAFEAVAANFFKRPDGYGVHSGAKRKRSGKTASTVNSVREKWKKASDTVLLSFQMTQMFGLQNFSLADPKFLVYLKTRAKGAAKFITVLLRIAQRDLEHSRSTQNKSIEKWTQILPPATFKGGIGGALTFSDDELERVFEICNKIFKKSLSEKEKDQFRKNNKNALYDRYNDEGFTDVTWAS